MAWDDGQWSATYFVSSKAEVLWWTGCKHVPGVYRLVALKEPNSLVPEPLNRVCGTDETGTVYIGKSNELQHRVAELVMQHRVGNLTKAHVPLSAKMAEKFDENRLAVCWEFSPEGASPRAREAQLLALYNAEFGELPPLNSQG